MAAGPGNRLNEWSCSRGTALQPAEKPLCERVLYQGASLLAPQMPQNESGLQPLGDISANSLANSAFFRKL
jgi:hypothetical protein